MSGLDKPWRFVTSALLIAIVLGGCGISPKYAEVEPFIPPPAAQDGRIYVFCRAGSSEGYEATLRVDGERVVSPWGGKLVARAIIYADVPAGTHEVKCSTILRNDTVLVTIEAGQTLYIEAFIRAGLLLSSVDLVVLMGPPETDLGNLHYVGPKVVMPERTE